MKKIAFLTLLFLTTLTAFAQDITGDWNGALKVQGIQLRLVFHITKTDTGYTATMDSPDQGAKGIPVTDYEDLQKREQWTIKGFFPGMPLQTKPTKDHKNQNSPILITLKM